MLLLRRFLPHILAAAGLVAAFWWFSHARYQAGYRAAQAEMAEQVRSAEEATKAAEARADAVSRARDAEFQEERNALHARVADLLSRPVPVRLCKPSGSSPVPSIPAAPGEPDGASAGPGPAVPPGPDIGPELVRYGSDCELYRAQVTALQGWIREQAR